MGDQQESHHNGLSLNVVKIARDHKQQGPKDMLGGGGTGDNILRKTLCSNYF